MNSVFVNPGIVASLIIVVIVSGIFFLLHKYKIQYVAVTQNINTILHDFTLSNLQINKLTTYMNVKYNEMLETLNF